VQPLRRRVAARPHALSFFICDFAAVEEPPKRPDADPGSVRRKFFLQFSQRDIAALLDLAKNELRFRLNPAGLTITTVTQSPPLRNGAMSPEALICACQRIALDALTLKRAAASRHERPSDMAAQTRRRRSREIAFAMHAGLLRQHTS
jgi:hypothetical protein